MTIDSDKLAAFAAVVREQGFSRAARALGKTQSAVSQAVIHLEADLGQALFVRGGRSLALTDAGVVLLEHAERVLGDMERTRERLSAIGELRAGTLRIGATDTLACYVLPPALAVFRSRYPGIDLTLVNRPSPETATAVAEGRLDVGVVALPLPAALETRGLSVAERLNVEALVPYEDVVIVPPGHALAARKLVRIADLSGLPLLLLDPSTGTRAWLDAAFERARVRPTVHMEMSSVEVLKRLVELGFGASVVPRLAVGREAQAKTLVALTLSEARQQRRVGLITPRAGSPSRAAAAFVDVARSSLGSGRSIGFSSYRGRRAAL